MNQLKTFLCFLIVSMGLLSCNDDDNVSSYEFEGELTSVQLYGGTENDVARAIIPTADGGFAVLGSTESIDGDITDKDWAGADYWLLKFDDTNNLEWTTTYGGTDDDQAHDLVQTVDGGFALIGYSKSSDGDATNNEGFHDNWIVKVDAQGNFEWEKSFGFSGHDHSYTILQYDDGFAIAGFLDVSASGGQGATGRHGVGEFWVHRLDLQGNIIWRKYFGGTHDERIHGLAKADDGGMILAGYTESPDFDVSNNNGTNDFWVVKVDEHGELIWENAFGGTEFEFANSITNGPDNTYIIAGSARSNNGDVSNNYGNADMWVIAIDDNGELLWEKNYGGSQLDDIFEISPSFETGYWAAGTSRSNDNDMIQNAGQNDAIVMQLTETGEIDLQFALGGMNFDYANDVKVIHDRKVIAVGETNSNDGHFTGNKGNYDAFIAIIE